MPGYKEVNLVEFDQVPPKFQCVACKLLLREAVQTDAAERLCRSCIEIIETTGVTQSSVEHFDVVCSIGSRIAV